jgi:hypothetical protein
MKIMIAVLLFLVLTSTGKTQDLSPVEPLTLLDTPTAGTLMRGSFRAHLSAYPDGGLLTGIDVGVTNRLMFGVAYGGTNLIGIGEVNWNPQVGVNLRYRLFEEGLSNPAFLIGYDNQGRGAYMDSTSRYREKSRGLFLAVSKNFNMLGTVGVHAGVNYSFETGDNDKDLNAFFGIDKSINPELALIAEYDFAFNDNASRSIGSGKGYLNAGLKWIFAGQLQIDFVVKNLLKNRNQLPHMSREIRISYVEIF